MRVLAVCALLLAACAVEDETGFSARSVSLATVEDLEAASKGSYAPAEVALNEGTWFFADALVGNLATDRKHGEKAARVRQLGRMTMLYDRNGAGSFTVWHASFGSDAPSSWQLMFSTDSGSSWTAAGEPVLTSSELSPATFAIEQAGPIRFELRKLDGGASRINFDDIVITDGFAPEIDAGLPDAAPPPPDPRTPGANLSPHTSMGIPSPAGTASWADYLSVKSEYVISYNSLRKQPNWVSWELHAGHLGDTPRQDDYRTDDTLPLGMPQASLADYSGSGWDRGHMCPSGDRTLSKPANSQTFYLSNMLPQAHDNNGGPWAKLEVYSRQLAEQGKQLYIVAGGIYAAKPPTIGNFVHVPSETWKVIVVLDEGQAGPGKVGVATRVIAVRMPNRDSAVAPTDSWQKYRVSVDSIEAATGLDLLSDVSPIVEPRVESRVDAL